MSICLVKQNDGTWVEKHQRFFIQRLQTFFFIFVTFLRFLTFFIFFWNVFYIYGFYRATSCVTAVFAVGRCPSVRPSVRHVHVLYCIQTAEDIIKHLSRPGSSMILVFDPQALIPNSRRTSSSGVQNTPGRLRFWTEIAVYLGNGRR